MFTRLLGLPEKPKKSLFLWGPRQTGKTTLLKKQYPNAFRIDLLKNEVLLRYLQRPAVLREEIASFSPAGLVVIDEIQKAPVLLDDVHYLIQESNQVFILCGSSARKIRRGHANLLGGRALRYELLGLSAMEIGKNFNLKRMLNTGFLPNHYQSRDFLLAIRSYVEDYLREEILQEGLIRNLPIFSNFLRVAAIGDTEIINLSNISRECGSSVSTVRDHYSILVDTLLGAFLPAFTLRAKRRTLHAPKFYFRDVGVVNHLARRGEIKQGSELFGKAFENWLFHELSIHSRYSGKYYDVSYWRLTTGVEVDFILGTGEIAIEAKGKATITSRDIKGLQQFKQDHPSVKKMMVVCLEKQNRKTQDGIFIVHYQDFLKMLWGGEIMG